MNFKKIKYKFDKITKRADKKWPVNARIHEVRGRNRLEDADSIEELNTQITYDKGRTVLSDDGEQELELLNHGTTGISVGYEYFKNRKDGKEEIELLKPDRQSFIPLDESLQGSGEDGENFSISKIHDIKKWKEWAEKEYQEKTSVVEVDDQHWIHNEKVQVFIMFLGAGIFFVLLGIGYSKVITKPILEQLQKLNKSLIPIAFTGLQGIRFKAEKALKR